MTDDELERIVREAEAREGWKYEGTDDGRIAAGSSIVLDYIKDDNAQFILDAIRALPILFSKWQEDKKRTEALEFQITLLVGKRAEGESFDPDTEIDW